MLIDYGSPGVFTALASAQVPPFAALCAMPELSVPASIIESAS